MDTYNKCLGISNRTPRVGYFLTMDPTYINLEFSVVEILKVT